MALGLDETEFIKKAAKIIVFNIEEAFSGYKEAFDNIISEESYNDIREKLLNEYVVGLVNKDSCIIQEQHLATKEIADMNVIYYDKNCRTYGLPVMNTTIMNTELEGYDIAQHELHERSIQHSFNEYKTHITPDKKNGHDIYKIYSNNRDFGAEVILYPGVLDKIAEKMNSNFFLIPYSISVFSAVSENLINLNTKSDTVSFLYDILRKNNEDLRKNNHADDVLSDNIYFYNSKEKSLYIAGSDTRIEF